MVDSGMRAGFSLSQSSNCLIDHIALEGTYPGGDPDLGVPLQGIIIDDGPYLDLGSGSYGNIISNCYVTKCRYEGYSIYGHDSRNNIMTQCVAENNNTYGFVIERFSNYNILSDCTVKGGSGYGIYLLDANYNLVTNNLISDIDGIGIYLRMVTRNNTVSDNVITDVSGTGIYIDTSATEDNYITDNTIVSPGLYGIYDEQGINNKYLRNKIISSIGAGIRIDGVGAQISNNIIEYCIETHGIWLYCGGRDVKDVTITDNTIVGCNNGIWLHVHTNAISDLIIERNHIHDKVADVSTTLDSGASIGETSIQAVNSDGMYLGMRIVIGGTETKTITGFHSTTYVTTPITVHLDTALTGNHSGGAAVVGVGNTWGTGIQATYANGGTTSGISIRNNILDSSLTTAIYGFTAADYRNNIGFVTENSGTDTLASAATTKVVTHGLAVTPVAGDIMVTPIESLGNAAFFWVDTLTSTQFTIPLNAAPGADVDFAWKAVAL